MKTRNENHDIEIEDITLIGDEDISIPRALEAVTVEDQPRLTDDQISAIKEKYSGHFKRSVFVAVVGGMGIATEHEFGYWPIPLWWYENDNYHQAMDYAMELNDLVFGIAEENAHVVIASTMRGSK